MNALALVAFNDGSNILIENVVEYGISERTEMLYFLCVNEHKVYVNPHRVRAIEVKSETDSQ